MADSTRQRKVADRIRQTVAHTLERHIKDPRIGFITITDCRVTGDLQQATVMYTVMGDEDQKKKTAQALRSAKGLIRSQVGKALGIRLTPELFFEQDNLMKSAARFDDILAQAKARDARIAHMSAGKNYAGDANPYKDNTSSVNNESIDE